MAQIASRMREILDEAKQALGEKSKKDSKLTIKLKDPLRSKMANEPKFRKLLKKVKPQGKYKTGKSAKRAFLAGLIRKMSGEDVEYNDEEKMVLEFIEENFEIVAEEDE